MSGPSAIARLLFLGLSLGGFAALADDPAPPAAAPPAPEAAPAAEPPPAPPPAPVPPELLRRIDDAEQTARIAARKLELFEEKQAEKAKEATSASADEKGYFIRSADKKTVLQFRALLQVDTRWFFGNDTVTNNVSFIDNDTFLIRRFRPEIAGTLVGLADFQITPDFAGGTVTVFDAFVDVHPFPWLRLKVGKYKPPIGLERLQSEGHYPFVERALDQNLAAGRDVGASLWGDLAGGLVTYTLGIYNGNPDNLNNSGLANTDIDSNHAKDFIGRLFAKPLRALPEAGTLGVGLAASTGNRKGRPPVGGGLPLVPTFRSDGQQTIFAYAVGPASDTTGALTTFAHLRETRLNPQLYYYVGPFGLLGEYVWIKQGVQRGNATAELTHQAYHVSVNYVLGGKPGYDGTTPDLPFDPSAGHLGAFEIAGRYEALIIDPDTFDKSNPAGGSYANGFANPTQAVSKAQGWTGALIWSPARTLRFLLNFEQTYFKDGGAAGADKVATNRKTESAILARVNVRF